VTERVPVEGGDHKCPGLLLLPFFLLWFASISAMPLFLAQFMSWLLPPVGRNVWNLSEGGNITLAYLRVPVLLWHLLCDPTNSETVLL
jgi:hypothetical protein